MAKVVRDGALESLARKSRTWLLRNVLLPLGDLAVRHPMISRLRFLEEAQWWDRERIHAYRDRLLASVLRTAYDEVPFYRDLMDRARVRPSEIRSPVDLPRLPIVDKPMLRQGYPKSVTRRTGQRTYESLTSGSTGSNFRVLEDHATAGWYRASFLLAVEWAGWTFGERHLQTGIAPERSILKRLKDSLLGCYYMSAYNLTDDELDQRLELMDHASVDHLWGYPGSLYYLALRAKGRGWNRRLRSVVTWGDNLYPHYRRTIERVFGVGVLDTYGCSEGIQVSAQCGSTSAYHIHALDTIVEFVDDEGMVVPEGQPGNIILTRLHAGPMPLIRYRVGDVGVGGGGPQCPCGRGFDLMASIQGRDTDIVFTPSGNRLVVHFFTGVLEHFPEVAAFQVVQEEIGCIVVRLVPNPGFSEQTGERIASALRERGADALAIHVECVEDIPVSSSGKRRFVIQRARPAWGRSGSDDPTR